MASPEIVNALIDRVIQREGGYVDNSADAGHATCWGITISTLRDWRRVPVSREDVAALTQAEAREIYRTVYFTASGFDRISDPNLLELMFDFGINSGVGTASMALQRIVGTIADGAIGPKTLAAMAAYPNAERLYWKVLCRRYNGEMHYIGRDYSQAQFADGWANRNEEFENKIN